MLRPQKGNSIVSFNDTLLNFGLGNTHNSEWQDTDQLKNIFIDLFVWRVHDVQFQLYSEAMHKQSILMYLGFKRTEVVILMYPPSCKRGTCWIHTDTLETIIWNMTSLFWL